MRARKMNQIKSLNIIKLRRAEGKPECYSIASGISLSLWFFQEGNMFIDLIDLPL